MSCFSGKIKEYPCISADCFTKENLESKAFFLSHCHKDHMDGLDSSAFANRIKHSSNIFIYCSETTLNLLMFNPAYTHLKNYLKGIPIDQPYLVSMPNEETRQTEVITVTLLSAGHCVGSVMFLFEGTNGNVLYTGDFRLSKGDAQRIKFFHSKGCIKDIKSVYVDTTFCLPQMMSVPSRKETKDAVVRVMDKWLCQGPNHMVSLQCKGMYGYEYLLKEIAQHYKTKIHISKERLALYQNLTDMTQYFTTDPNTTKIHSCKWNKTPKGVRSSLPCGFTLPNGIVPKVIKIKPTSMWFARHPDPLPADSTRYVKEKRTWRVIHSMHASMEEIIDLVAYLKPYHVYPNVEPAGLYTLDDAWNWLKEFTRIDECDSCNEEDSGHTNFKVKASEFNIPMRHNLDQVKPLQLPSKQTAPSQSVTAAYKELGLEEDVNLAPLPVKRRRRLQNSCSNTDVLKKIDNTKKYNIRLVISDTSPLHGDEERLGMGNAMDLSDKLRETAQSNESRGIVIGSIGSELNVKDDNQSSFSTRDSEDFAQHEQQNAIETSSLETGLASEERNVSNSEDDGSHEGVLTDREKASHVTDLERNSSVSSASSIKTGSSTGVLDDNFDIPGSPGTRIPRAEVLADLHRRMNNGKLSIGRSLSFGP